MADWDRGTNILLDGQMAIDWITSRYMEGTSTARLDAEEDFGLQEG